MKYGGTSVGSVEKIKNVAEIICNRKASGDDIVVVVSAMGKSTDSLIGMMKEISKKPCKRDLDMLISTGEQVSIALLSAAIKERGFKSVSLTGQQAGIETNDIHSKARISKVRSETISTHLTADTIVVVAGFQGVTPTGDITTLGRGGSDTTAVSLAASLRGSCEIYTDVDGVYTVDPRLFPQAKKLQTISYEEMLEMASLGASVLETRSVEMASKYNVPLYVALNTGEYSGTYITERNEQMESNLITGLSIDDDCLMVTVNMLPYNTGKVADLFTTLANKNIIVDMISITAPYKDHVNVSFTSKHDDLEEIVEVTNSLGDNTEIITEINSQLIKLSVVGVGMVTNSGVAARMFQLFSDNGIPYQQVTTSEISISYTINKSDKDKAILVIANEFDL